MRFLMLAVVALLSVATAAKADSAAPWVDDQKLIDQVMQDVQAGGVMAVERRRDEMEKALANAKHTTELASAAGFRLTDGPSDTLLAMMSASHDGKSATAIPNPYPMMALALGSYYNETGRSEDALRALDTGIAVAPMAAMRPVLVVERGNALASLKRFDQVLANGDEGLKIPGLDPKIRAHLQRERGYALTELSRLDEAEAAYSDSLKDDPGNQTAEHELQYVARLKAGAKPAPGAGQLAPLQKPQQP